jgi:hypothetical protein
MRGGGVIARHFPSGTVGRLYIGLPHHLRSHGAILAVTCRPRMPSLKPGGKPLTFLRVRNGIILGGRDAALRASGSCFAGEMAWFAFETLDEAHEYIRKSLPNLGIELLNESQVSTFDER